MASVSVIVPFSAETAGAAADIARSLHGRAEVLLAGPTEPPVALSNGTRFVHATGKGRAIRDALERVRSDITVIQDADPSYPTEYERLIRPIAQDDADAVFARRTGGGRPLADVALAHLANFVTDAPLVDPLSGQRAFRTEALKSVQLNADGDDIDPEIVVKLSAQLFRFAEVPVELPRFPRQPLLSQLARARTLLRYATTSNDADNLHEGYNTLARMDSGAPNYNAWLGRRFREHCGRRVLEIGAGIGTITAQIEAGRELVIALEVDRFFVDRLRNRFRGKPHIRPYLSDVALADWEGLRNERIDTIVLSNVLEHIPDDLGALRRFRQILQPGGSLVILVPALPALFGAIDEAVGHHRRYTAESLRRALEDTGFSIDTLEWMNLVGIPGWFVNSRLLRRRSVPPLQLRLYDRLAPYIARAESHVRLPIGMSLFAVARASARQARGSGAPAAVWRDSTVRSRLYGAGLS